MTSRERVVAALHRQPVDHLPLCVDTLCHGGVKSLSDCLPDRRELARYYQSLGLDTGIMVGGALLGPTSNPAVTFREWQEQPAGEPCPLLHREYETAAGTLQQVIRRTEDYSGKDTVATLFSDFNVPPARSLHYLVEQESDLEALEYLLRPLSGEALWEYRADAARAREFCDQHDLTLSVYLLGLGDPLIWMSGVERTVEIALLEKEFCRRYVEIVAAWEYRLLELALESGVQHVVRRGLYEGMDFWSPRLYEEFLLAPLQAEVELTHQAGATLEYAMLSGYMPMLDLIRRSGADMLGNLDPHARGTDIAAVRVAIGDAVTLCGGVNNYHTLELGTEAEVRQAVEQAIAAFTPATGCLLAPSDWICYLDSTAASAARGERNFQVMIDTWREATGA
jgi:hypothetical protein